MIYLLNAVIMIMLLIILIILLSHKDTSSIKMDKVIFQTFWTAPMKNNKVLRDSVFIAALSLAYAHRSGYIVRMHTDNKGYELLKGLGYDYITNDLEKIPHDIDPEKFFAYPKYFAGLSEPLGAVHTDFDVFLKQPCLDQFFSNPSVDMVLQNREMFSVSGLDYTRIRDRFSKLGAPASLPVDHMIASNVGVIGFKKQDLKDKYYQVYFDYIDFYKGMVEELDGINTELMAEQITADSLASDNTMYILPPSWGGYTTEVTAAADRIGYQHLQGPEKWKKDSREKIRKLLQYMFPDMWEKVMKIKECRDD